ncbi:MAG: hypothetical protein DMD84_27740 [Candidatus Rokuibacteriota bacterium]|nr:MAG: hypothetical protein DMD84_27740 [Candidatus Rokubacteria bacterium]
MARLRLRPGHGPVSGGRGSLDRRLRHARGERHGRGGRSVMRYEQIFVLEGSVSDDTGTCAAGDYARRPPGCVHTVRSTGGALVLAVMSGGTESVPDGRS